MSSNNNQLNLRKYLHFIIAAAIVYKFSFVRTSFNSYQFDVNDILNEKFMPAYLLAHEFKSFLAGGGGGGGSSNITREEFYQSDNRSCNFTSAFSTMGFHRKMMNEYLATNFLAKQILSEFPLDSVQPMMEKRIGAISKNSTDSAKEVLSSSNSNHRQGKYIQNELLEDAGSASYRSWLDKTTTLDDIQRQLTENTQSPVADFKPLQQGANANRKALDSDEESIEEEDFDEGDITGYAYTGGAAVDSVPSYPNVLPAPHHRHHLPFDATNTVQQMPPVSPTAGSKNGYYPSSGHDSSYETYGQTHHVQPQLSTQIKEIGLKDVLEIALTTLAFLSFGMFILQVLMCITMNKEDTSSLMMMPMESPETGTLIQATNEGATEEIRRRKRNLPENHRLQIMNDLSRRVLHSIDAVLVLPKDNGRCHYHSLCELNKFAREQKNGIKVWVPVWSLGMTWFSSRMTLANETTGNPILQSLKASVIGLGNGNCTNIYRGCQMDIIAAERNEIDRRIKNGELRDHFDWHS